MQLISQNYQWSAH